MTDIVLVDVSSSMRWSDGFLGLFGSSRMNIAKEFIRKLVRLRLNGQRNIPANDARHRVMLCPFGLNLMLNEPKIKPEELEVPILSLKAEDSQTCLYDALRTAVNYVKDNIRHGDQYRLLVLTDGNDTASDESCRKEFEAWFIKNLNALQLSTTVFSLDSSPKQFVKNLIYRLPSSLGGFRFLVRDVDPEKLAKEYVDLHPNYEKLHESRRFHLAPSLGGPEITERLFVVEYEVLPSVPTSAPRDKLEAQNLTQRVTKVPRSVLNNVYA